MSATFGAFDTTFRVEHGKPPTGQQIFDAAIEQRKADKKG